LVKLEVNGSLVITLKTKCQSLQEDRVIDILRSLFNIGGLASWKTNSRDGKWKLRKNDIVEKRNEDLK
jgi:hypothetical protein